MISEKTLIVDFYYTAEHSVRVLDNYKIILPLQVGRLPDHSPLRAHRWVASPPNNLKPDLQVYRTMSPYK